MTAWIIFSVVGCLSSLALIPVYAITGADWAYYTGVGLLMAVGIVNLIVGIVALVGVIA